MKTNTRLLIGFHKHVLRCHCVLVDSSVLQCLHIERVNSMTPPSVCQLKSENQYNGAFCTDFFCNNL